MTAQVKPRHIIVKVSGHHLALAQPWVRKLDIKKFPAPANDAEINR